MCNCAQTRAELGSAIRRGAIVEATKVAVRGAAEMASQVRKIVKPPVVRNPRR